MKWKCPMCDNKYDTEEEVKKCIEKDNISLIFEETLDKLTNEEYDKWVLSWFSSEFIIDVWNNWEDETKQKQTEVIKKIIEGRI